MAREGKEAKCSYCGESADLEAGRRLFQGDGDVYICTSCAITCAEMAQEYLNAAMAKGSKAAKKAVKKLMKPSEIKAYLDQYVIGQEHAKEVLSVAVYNHYKKLQHSAKNDANKIEMEKSNILLLGNTGTGKTFMLKTIAKMLDVPFAITDATSLTSAGYVGADVETCIQKLFTQSGEDVEKTQMGIIYLDEVDKLSRKGENVSITRDVSGEGVQQALLKMMEGSIVEITPTGLRKHPSAETVKIDTSNILFICGGSFEGIEQIINTRTKKVTASNSIGFGGSVRSKTELDKGPEYDEIIHDVKVEDLKKYGMLPEFLGRLPIIATLQKLDKDALVKILTEPKNAITKQFMELMSMDGVALKFDVDALEYIADQAIKRGTGARSLRNILEDSLLKYMYQIPDDPSIVSMTVTRESLENGAEPKIERKEAI
jgi:ATP-dependent Clp protease ATP-binding subunit ClpX